MVLEEALSGTVVGLGITHHKPPVLRICSYVYCEHKKIVELSVIQRLRIVRGENQNPDSARIRALGQLGEGNLHELFQA